MKYWFHIIQTYFKVIWKEKKIIGGEKLLKIAASKTGTVTALTFTYLSVKPILIVKPV